MLTEEEDSPESFFAEFVRPVGPPPFEPPKALEFEGETVEDFMAIFESGPGHQAKLPEVNEPVKVSNAAASYLESLVQEAVSDERFNGRRFYQRVLGHVVGHKSIASAYKRIHAAVGGIVADYTLMSILRVGFFIEPVLLPKVETTKFEVRWGDRLDPKDPRRASYDDCLDICLRLLSEVAAEIHLKSRQETLALYCGNSLLAYEVPIDYVQVKGPLHKETNLCWLWDEAPSRALRLRAHLLSESNPYRALFQRVYEKILVKSYLTDRATTGDYKTNREKRWETHPDSAQFALRQSCMEIEYTLLGQLCHFESFPRELLEELLGLGLIPTSTQVQRCPVTYEVLNFLRFVEEVNNPTQGESNFHVGHLHPLKAGLHFGHNANNIAWVTQDGNRIQGKLTISETRALLQRIRENEHAVGVERL